MKITKVDALRIDRYCFAHIHTDAGITGLGEAGAWGFVDASATAIAQFADYLVGQDPRRIEHHFQYCNRANHFRGAAIMGALSAIDIALWDIAGKFHQVPVHQLLGGACRDRVRVYHHVRGPDTASLVAACKEVVNKGFTAIGHLTPFVDAPRSTPFGKAHAELISEAEARVGAYRDAVGDKVDLCIEIHRQLTPPQAIVLGQALAPFRPMYLEDPIRPDSIDAMAQVAAACPVPIATGERLHGVQEFAALAHHQAAAYLRPDICLVGGISGGKKIAAIGEGFELGIIPHNPKSLSPVSTAACLQVAACVPNVVIQEYAGDDYAGKKSAIVNSDVQVSDDGYMIIPQTPGIGVSLAPDAAERFPPVSNRPYSRLHHDGSVVDQ